MTVNDQTLQSPFPPVTRDRTWPMMAHLSAYAMFVVPFGNAVGPLIVWLAKRDEDTEVDQHGCDSLNFQITYLLLNLLVVIGLVVVAVMVGVSALTVPESNGPRPGFGLAVGGIIGTVIAVCFFGGYVILNWVLIAVNSVRAYNGKPSVYFPTIRFVKPRFTQATQEPPSQPKIT